MNHRPQWFVSNVLDTTYIPKNVHKMYKDIGQHPSRYSTVIEKWFANYRSTEGTDGIARIIPPGTCAGCYLSWLSSLFAFVWNYAITFINVLMLTQNQLSCMLSYTITLHMLLICLENLLEWSQHDPSDIPFMAFFTDRNPKKMFHLNSDKSLNILSAK